MSFWDTSALGKLYIKENDSAFYKALANADGRIDVAQVAVFEAYVVFHRAEFDGRITTGVAATLVSEFQRDVDLGVVVVHQPESLEQQFYKVVDDCLAANPPILLRTLDALHLATAIAVGETNFATADLRQHAAAGELGCTVSSP